MQNVNSKNCIASYLRLGFKLVFISCVHTPYLCDAEMIIQMEKF